MKKVSKTIIKKTAPVPFRTPGAYKIKTQKENF